jgi:hypothetical protein
MSMKIHIDNPSSNSLPTDITEDKLFNAVRKSGYPLQVIIAKILQDCLGKYNKIQEEWCFPNDEIGEIRSIDILAQKILFDPQKIPDVRPILNLLIECKQSQLPYVFFLSDIAALFKSPSFPDFAGLHGEGIYGDSGIVVPILTGIGLDSHPFINNPAEYSLTFSKCVRKGKDIELSGSDAYLGIVLPLLKAMQHFKATKKPPTTAQFFDCHLPLCVGVLDAPMIGIRLVNGTQEGVYLPWVRIFRHQSESLRIWENISIIDIVHKDYFHTYLNSHVLPFAKVFAKKCKTYQRRLAKAICYKDLSKPINSRQTEDK